MFSDKEYIIVCGGGLGVCFWFFILRISGALSNGQTPWVFEHMRSMQSLVIIPFAILIYLHIRMLYEARKFMDDKLKEGFKDSYKFLYWSETISVVIALTFIFGLFDLPYYIDAWNSDPIWALKLSFYPYWWYEAFLTGFLHGSTSYQTAVVWYYPLFIFSLVLEIITYKKYFFAKSIYCHLHPSVPCSDIYNAFLTKYKNGRNSHNLIIQKDELAEIEIPENSQYKAIPKKEQSEEDVESPLGKNLGNNSLYVVDENLLPKRRNVFKTQAEIDEENGFFGGEDIKDNMFLFKRSKNAENQKSEPKNTANTQSAAQSGSAEESNPTVQGKKDQPLDHEIPMDFDYQSFYRTNKEKELQSKNKSAEATLTGLDITESTAAKGSAAANQPMESGAAIDDEIPLDFDYQSFYRFKEEKKEEKQEETENANAQANLVTCPFCGTVNANGREECIFCGAELNTQE